MFDAIGRHAIAELIEVTSPVTYKSVSKKTGNFNSLNFKTREDYVQPVEEEMPKFAIVSNNSGYTNVSDGATGQLGIDQIIVDTNSIVSVSTNTVTLAEAGWYDVFVDVNLEVNSGSPTSGDGYIIVHLACNSTGYDDTFAFFGTPTGSILEFADLNFVCNPIHVSAGNEVTIELENQTGHDVAALMLSMEFTKKS